MNISLSQLPRMVSSGPMFVYVPETVGDEETIAEAHVVEASVVVNAIRKTTDPAVAKRTMDAKIVQAATVNRANAERLMQNIGISHSTRSAALGGLWTWLTGTGRLSDLSAYSPEQREQLMAYVKASNLDVVERTFTSDELDAILAKIQAGTPPPSGVASLVDPYSAAAQAYKAEVVAALAPLGETATTTGGKAADAVGAGIVAMYQANASSPGRSFEWLGKAKWVVGLATLGVGGYLLWPTIHKYVGADSMVGRKLNAARTLLGGIS